MERWASGMCTDFEFCGCPILAFCLRQASRLKSFVHKVFLVQLVKCKVIPRWFHLQNKMPLIFHRIMKSQKQMSVFFLD